MKLIQQKLHIVFADFDDIKNPLLGAGQAWSTYEIGRRLVKQSHKVTVISSKYPGSKDRVEAGITYKHIGIGTRNIRINNVAYILALPLHVAIQKADILVECFTAPISTLFTPLFTKAVVIAKSTSFEAERFAKLYHLPFHYIERFGSRFYQYFVPSTIASDEKMKRLNPHITSRIIPEGVCDTFFSISQKQKKYILFLGRLDMSQKGIDLLLKAFANIAKTTPHKLVIGGHGPDEEKVRSLVEELNLTDKVIFAGSLYGKEKRKIMKQASVMVLPSRHEGFSLVTLEALAAGLPIVMFNIPGLAWTDTILPVKAKPFDTADYASVLSKYLNGSVKKSPAAYKTFAKRFSWDAVSQSYMQFIKEAREEHFLSKQRQTFGIVSFLKGKLRSYLLPKPQQKRYIPISLPGYRFVKSIKPAVRNLMHATSLYVDKKGLKIVIRDLQYDYKSVEYYQAVNEVTMLRILNKKHSPEHNEYITTFPKLLSFSDSNNRLLLVREYVQGMEMKNLSSSQKIAVLEASVSGLEHISHQLTKKEKQSISKRTPLQMVIAFPFYLVVTILKEPKLWRHFLRVGLRFFTLHHYSTFSAPEYVLSHRDLHERNIFVNKKQIHIIDSEIMVLAERDTDAAYIVRFYADQLTDSELVSLLNRLVKTTEQKERFLRLTLFYTVQLLATLYKSHVDYPAAIRYLCILQKTLMPVLGLQMRSSLAKVLPVFPKDIALEIK